MQGDSANKVLNKVLAERRLYNINMCILFLRGVVAEALTYTSELLVLEVIISVAIRVGEVLPRDFSLEHQCVYVQ